MSRSLKVAPKSIEEVKLSIKRRGYPSQRAFAIELGLSRDTVSRFLNGKPVDYLNFVEISEQLGLKWQDLTDLANEGNGFQDWGDASAVPEFFGRTDELKRLKTWIVKDSCRVVAILGMAGIGKSSLSVKLAEDIQNEFEYVIWRSLLNAPPITEILKQWIKFLSNQQQNLIPDSAEDQIRLLIDDYLRKHRCLLILDNFETILEEKGGYASEAGEYQEGFEDYGKLLKQIAIASHQSCLLLTSREKPQEIAILEVREIPVRSLELRGLDWQDGKKIFSDEFDISEENWEKLITKYDGNPLALKIADNHIREVFLGDIEGFLQQEKQVLFNDLKYLLDWYFKRLSEQEKEIMYWLAINREPVSISELKEDILSLLAKEQIPSTLQSLQRRLPLERSKTGFTLQPVLIEYVTDRLIEQVCQEIGNNKENEKIEIFNRHALLKAQAKDNVRKIQARLILKPIYNWFEYDWENQSNLKDKLSNILSNLKQISPKLGYAAGNILNLLCELKIDLKDDNFSDFSDLVIWQADLRGVKLHDVNFARADLSKSIFTQTLASVYSVAFNPEGTRLASGDAKGKISLWQVKDGESLNPLKGHNDDWINSVAFSPDGKTLASASDDKTVKLWDVDTGECLRNLTEHTDWVTSVAFSPDGKTLASGSEDKTVRIWDVNTGECLHTLKEHIGRIWSVAFSTKDKDNILASGSEDQTVKLWDVNTGKCLQTLSGHNETIRSVAFSTKDNILASSSEDQTVKLWDVNTGQCLRTLQGHSNWVWSVAFSLDGETLASANEDKTLRIWDVNTGQCLNTLPGHTDKIWSIAFSIKDKNILASGSQDKTVRIWDVNTGQCLRTLKGHTDWVWSVAFSPDGHTIASGSNDRTVKLWDVKTDECLHTLEEHTDRVTSVAFSPDGKTLASGSEDRTVKLWDVNTGECLRTLKGEEGHTERIWSVAFSPDGETLASGSEDRTVKLWDVNTGECLRTLKGEKGHKEIIWSVAFSPDGKTLASGSEDRTVKLWDVKTGECLRTLKGHTDWITSVAFNPDGKTLASASRDETINLWDVQKGKLLRKPLKVPKPYEGMNVIDVKGLTEAQKDDLKSLGAVEK